MNVKIYLKKNREYVLKTVYSGLFLAVALLLPFLTGQVPQIGGMLCPMHVPVLLCGFFCGWQYGLCVGFASPLLRFLLFGMPSIFPGGLAMAFELSVYGAVSGLLYRLLPKKPVCVYISLIAAMIAGRAVWGVARFFFAGLNGSSFPFSAFFAGAVVNAVPGIILQLVIIPPAVILFRKYGEKNN